MRIAGVYVGPGLGGGVGWGGLNIKTVRSPTSSNFLQGILSSHHRIFQNNHERAFGIFKE